MHLYGLTMLIVYFLIIHSLITGAQQDQLVVVNPTEPLNKTDGATKRVWLFLMTSSGMVLNGTMSLATTGEF